MSKKQRWKQGCIIKIDLQNGWFAFAHLDKKPLMTFYDIRSRGEYNIKEIIKHPVLFRIAVMSFAIAKGRWEIVDKLPVDHEQLDEPFFANNPVGSNEYYKVKDGDPLISSTYEECKNLEVYSVWFPEQVEDRLRDHFDGKPNKWVELGKIKPPSPVT